MTTHTTYPTESILGFGVRNLFRPKRNKFWILEYGIDSARNGINSVLQRNQFWVLEYGIDSARNGINSVLQRNKFRTPKAIPPLPHEQEQVGNQNMLPNLY